MDEIMDMLKDLVPLDEVATPVFNLTVKAARHRAALNMLPVPAFRLNGSRRGPLYIHKTDLEGYLNGVIAKAKAANQQMAKAGAI